jgi:hypothetical protein
VVQTNRREFLELLLPSDLAAGGPLHRNTAAFPLFLFLLRPRAYLKRFEKFQGYSCKITGPPNSKAVNFKNMQKIQKNVKPIGFEFLY